MGLACLELGSCRHRIQAFWTWFCCWWCRTRSCQPCGCTSTRQLLVLAFCCQQGTSPWASPRRQANPVVLLHQSRWRCSAWSKARIDDVDLEKCLHAMSRCPGSTAPKHLWLCNWLQWASPLQPWCSPLESAAQSLPVASNHGRVQHLLLLQLLRHLRLPMMLEIAVDIQWKPLELKTPLQWLPACLVVPCEAEMQAMRNGQSTLHNTEVAQVSPKCNGLAIALSLRAISSSANLYLTSVGWFWTICTVMALCYATCSSCSAAALICITNFECNKIHWSFPVAVSKLWKEGNCFVSRLGRIQDPSSMQNWGCHVLQSINEHVKPVLQEFDSAGDRKHAWKNIRRGLHICLHV